MPRTTGQLRHALTITALVAGLTLAGGASAWGAGRAFAAPTQSARAAIHWPRIDQRAEQAYWNRRSGGFTGALRQAAVAKIAALPTASSLPPVHSASSAARPDIGYAPGYAPGTPSGPWLPAGPAPITYNGTAYSGRVTALAVDPTSSGASTTIYLGAAGGGVWKSINNGRTWTPLTDTQQSMATGAITLDPTNHNIIYVGTGEPNQSLDSHYGSGVLKSTNGGATWTLYGAAQFGPRASAISRILVNPENNQQLWVASTSGLWTSTDGGQTYSAVSALPTGYTVDALEMDAAANPITLLATVRDQGLYRSTDAGATWTQVTTGLPTSSNWHRSALAVAPSNPAIAYLVITNSDAAGDVYVSGSYNGGYYTTDAGATWTQMASLNQDFTASGGEAQGWYDLYLAVDPKNDATLYGGGIDVAITTNARAATGNWQNITDVYGFDNSAIHPDQHAIAFPACSAAPCPAYFGTDGGIFYSSNTTSADPTTVTYADLNSAGLSIGTYTGGDLTNNYVNGRLALGGTQDNGTTLYTGNPAQPMTWGGAGGFTAIDWSNPSIMYTENPYGLVYKTTNAGAHWNPANAGLDGTNVAFYMPFVLDRANDLHLIAGTDAVYESANGAGSWYQSSQTLTTGGDYLTAVAVAPSNSAVIYAGSSDGHIYMTTHGNSGTSSTYTVTNGGSPLPGASWITSIAVDPADSTGMTAFATTGLFLYGNTGHVYKTTNGGTNWTDISGALPSFPVNSVVVYSSGATRVLVIGTDLGVYYTTSDGATWTALTTNLPNVPVEQLALDGQRTTIMAFTHGRGEWAINIPNSDKTAGTGDTPGIYRPSNGVFYLRNSLTTGYANESARFGPIGAGIYPVVGDWTGSGVDAVGVYNSHTAAFYLASGNTGTPSLYKAFTFGIPGDIPLVGDWNGDGVDGVGVFRPSTGKIYLRNSLTTGTADYTMVYGNPGDVPLAGDWSGQGHDTVGVYRPSSHSFFLTNTLCTCTPTTTYHVTFGISGDAPFTGDWTHAGHTGLGVFRVSNGVIYLRNDPTTTGTANYSLVFGNPNDQPIAGHWV